MRPGNILWLSLAIYGQLTAGRPQEVDLEVLDEIFGGDALERAGLLAPNTGSSYTATQAKEVAKPADYVAAVTAAGGSSAYSPTVSKAQVTVNTEAKNCADYTASLGYMCVPYYQCEKGTIITDGAGLIDIRGGFGDINVTDSKCPGFLDVCCKDPDFVPPPAPKLVYKPKCGNHNVGGLGVRIQGFKDSESQFGEWPHMCAVLFEKVDQYGATSSQFKCGGSLIAPGVILTGAHCVQEFRTNPQALKIRCGEWDTQRASEPYPHQDRFVSSLTIHPEFNPANLANDFAVLFLAEDFQLDFHIDTVCLPPPNEIYDYQNCFATGWGKDKFGADGQYQVVLKEVALPVVNNLQCENSLRTTKLGRKFKLDDSFMCAGGVVGKDTCKGDGGSPLVCPSKADPNIFQQAGIVAWGVGCGESGVPGVYASVSQAVCWIDQVVTCHYGAKTNNYNSFFAYPQASCGAWLTGAQKELTDSIASAKTPELGAAFSQALTSLQKCPVRWVQQTNTGAGGKTVAGDYGTRILVDEEGLEEEAAVVEEEEGQEEQGEVNFEK